MVSNFTKFSFGKFLFRENDVCITFRDFFWPSLYDFSDLVKINDVFSKFFSIYYASGPTGSGGRSRAALPILYHNNSPIWNDILRLKVPIEKFYNSHIRMEFRHCSAKDKNDKKLIGFSFIHLMDMDETTIKDGIHNLCLYKCEDATKFENCGIYLGMNFIGKKNLVYFFATFWD